MEEAKFTLSEHLEELRSRLWKVVLAVLVLGGAALFHARTLFELLMRPVLQALPEESRALVYTSGIEEVNVLLKVGLYAGLFLAVPVTLFQIWRFVAPGLLPNERRMIGPFVGFGSLFFVGGALFCYFVVLPEMFQFLLRPAETGEVRERVELARPRGEDAARYLFLGDAVRATALANGATEALGRSGGGSIGAPPVMTDSRVEVKERLARLGRLIDAAIAQPQTQRTELARALALRQEAVELLAKDQLRSASAKLEEAATAFSAALPDRQAAAVTVWKAERHLAAALGELGREEWTRPMLSMREQLSLVLVLEIAFGAIFELPLIMALLALVGILKFRWVARYQRYAILACVAVAAIITPTGDMVNLSLMAAPMIVCYELGVVLVWIFERRRAAREASDESGETPEATA